MKTFCVALIFVAAVCVAEESCEKGKNVKLSKILKMVCKNDSWVPVEKVVKDKRGKPKGPPCEDALGKDQCLAERGHCNQYTQKGKEMEIDCPETCGSCDGCRCQDNSKWHTYCPFWSQYCNSAGVLGIWMGDNCRKTCNKCRCGCCSYAGKAHRVGETILLPDKCGEMVCEEGLVANASKLLPGALLHNVSHPEELTLTFKMKFRGSQCCILPTDAEVGFKTLKKGSMVAEGWIGIINMLPASCCHGVICVPLDNSTNSNFSPTSTATKTTTSTTTTTSTATTSSTTTTTSSTTSAIALRKNDDQCNQPYTILNEAWRKIKYNPSGESPCNEECENALSAGWYRFKEPAGFKLPIIPPLSSGQSCDVCQTDASAWIKEKKDPILGEGVIDINICFAWSTECSWETQAKAVACKDGFGALYYLYQLKATPNCDLAYCALGA